MILLVEFAHMMILMLVEYFSIVRRRAAWASRLRASASLMMTTRGVDVEFPQVSLEAGQKRCLSTCL